MRKTNAPSPKFVICIEADEDNDLEVRKIYPVLPDEKAAEVDWLRVIDDSGEDYLYPAGKFVEVSFAPEVERAILQTA